ncbi:transglutaminase family protein [Mesorhizobium sp. M0047]|uniref:transglutaminase family protein n=1 Tax=Mesorhizobium sp. M0047 TaxID=2956859 RepID=UPI003335D9CA
MIGAGATALVANKAAAQEATASTVAARVAEAEQQIVRRRAGGDSIPAEWVVERLGVGLSKRDRHIAAFHIVRNVPYKLTAWKGDPDSLFTLGRGDCRHKSAAFLRLMRAWDFHARPVQVPFDWADLPVPRSVLQPLLETRGIHDSVEVRIDGAMALVDPTWDPPLGAAGFPVLADWDGIGPTLGITSKADTIVRRGDVEAGTDLYSYFGINWPERDRTLAFNRALNAWTDEVRARIGSAKG